MSIRTVAIIVAALVVIGTAYEIWFAAGPHREIGAASEQSNPERQYANSVRVSFINPKNRIAYEVRQRFLALESQMPSFDRPNFGPDVDVIAAFQSSPWNMTMIEEGRNGQLYPVFAYAQGPGLQHTEYSQIKNGHPLQLSQGAWYDVYKSNPSGLVSLNGLQPTCRDVRSSSSSLAATGPTIRVTKNGLDRATDGVAGLPGVNLICYRLGAENLLELGNGGEGVLYRVVGSSLIPALRGPIKFADARGSFAVASIESADLTSTTATYTFDFLALRPRLSGR